MVMSALPGKMYKLLLQHHFLVQHRHNNRKMHRPLLQVDAYWRTLVLTLLASGIKAFSSAWGCAGRTFALRAQNDITPRGDALWKQQSPILLISISLSSINGLTTRLRVLPVFHTCV